jgi:two-component system, NtrC family, sensor histidine kinase HydH
MELALPSRRNRTIMITTMAVFMLGLALSFSTWRNLRQQQDSFHEHALVTARSIAAGIEINLRRELRLPTTPEHANTLLHLHRALARELLLDYIKRTDARFIGLYNPLGHILLSSHDDPRAIQNQLPTIAWASMGNEGEWSGQMNFEGQPIMVLGRISHLTSAAGCPDGQCPPDKQPPLLIIGVDMTQHLAAFGKYKRTAILQTGYILAVTIVFWVLLLGFLQRNEQGKRLQRLESFNARLLDNMPDGLLTLSADGTVVAANPAATSLMGGQTLIGQPLSNLFSTLGLSTGKQPGQEWTTLKTCDRHLEILQLPLKDGSEQSLVLVRDRTELAGLERELHRNEKLAAIGRMAAGVAHEIRNPLSALRGFAQFFAKKLAGRDPEELYARTMVQEADRLNRVITDLLFLARPRQLDFVQVPLAEIFQEVHTLLSMDVETKNGRLEFKSEVATVLADRDALKQAVINLLMNSVEALPESDGLIELRAEPHDKGTWVRVRDNGRGMAPEELEHALEPFFTTRDKGTGLGLAIVHTIMQEHGGNIEIETTEPTGTVVSLFFPANHTESIT